MQGAVSAAASDAPLKSALVTLKTGDESFQQLTDSRGHFIFTSLPPGAYEVHASKAGYVREGYRLESGAAKETLELKPGEKLDRIQFRLSRAGVIVGRVTDENGEAIAGAQMEALASGSRNGDWIQMVEGKFAMTNDLGEYRIYNLPPGNYYDSATDSGSREFMNLPKVTFVFGPSNYPTLYYPGVTRGGEAQKVRVKAGEEIRVDLSLRPEKLLTVSGWVLDPKGKSAAHAEVVLNPEDGGVTYGRPLLSQYFADAQGKFVIKAVFPGSYLVSATLSSPGKEYWTAQPIEVTGDNVTGLQLQLRATLKIAGKVMTAGGGGELHLHELTIYTIPDNASDVQIAKIENDGTFAVDKVEPTLHRLRVTSLPDGYYLRSAFSGKQNVLENGLDLRDGVDPNEMLKVTIGPGAAQVEGTVLHRDQPVHSALVRLFPESPVTLNHEDLFRVMNTDENGHFVIRNMPPGSYRLRAYASAAVGTDDDASSSDSANTATIVLAQSESKTVQLKLP